MDRRTDCLHAQFHESAESSHDARAEWAELYANAKIEGRRFEGDLWVDGNTLVHNILYFHTLDEILAALSLAKCELGSVELLRKSRPGQGREYLIAIQGTLAV